MGMADVVIDGMADFATIIFDFKKKQKKKKKKKENKIKIK